LARVKGTAGTLRMTRCRSRSASLLSQTGDAVARHFREALSEVAIEPRHFALLRAIGTESSSQQFLAEKLHIPASSMVALLDQLEARGLVGRQHDPSDRRVRIVEMTATGRELLVQAMERAIGIEQLVSGDLGSDEREQLIRLLQRVAGKLGLWSGIHPGLGRGQDGACED